MTGKVRRGRESSAQGQILPILPNFAKKNVQKREKTLEDYIAMSEIFKIEKSRKLWLQISRFEGTLEV